MIEVDDRKDAGEGQLQNQGRERGGRYSEIDLRPMRRRGRHFCARGSGSAVRQLFFIVVEPGTRALLVPVSDSTLGEIVRRHLEGHAVTGQHPDSVSSQFASEVCQDRSVLIQLYAEQPAGEFFDYGSGYFNAVFFTHPPPNWGV